MGKLEPSATFSNGRYRLDRLVVDDDAVTVWQATDVARGCRVQLSVFARGSTVLSHGRAGDGMFVAIDADDEQAQPEPEPEPEWAPPHRAWPWAAAALACTLLAFAGWYAASARSHPTGATTITAAQIPAPTISVPPPPPAAKPAETQAPAPRPAHHAPSRIKPRPQRATTVYEPLTI